MMKLLLGFTLLGLFILISPTSGQRPICTDDFKQGTCYCKLNDGSGTAIDLTALVLKTTGNPLQGRIDGDPSGVPYFFSFCVPITNRTSLPVCNNVASVCRQNWAGGDEDLGRPQYTRFENRTSYFVQCPTPALVMDNPFDGRTRAVAFLHCNKTINDVIFTPRDYYGDQDPDLYYLYFMELTGSVFCPVPIRDEPNLHN